jgi:hypothetical protein
VANKDLTALAQQQRERRLSEYAATLMQRRREKIKEKMRQKAAETEELRRKQEAAEIEAKRAAKTLAEKQNEMRKVRVQLERDLAAKRVRERLQRKKSERDSNFNNVMSAPEGEDPPQQSQTETPNYEGSEFSDESDSLTSMDDPPLRRYTPLRRNSMPTLTIPLPPNPPGSPQKGVKVTPPMSRMPPMPPQPSSWDGNI